MQDLKTVKECVVTFIETISEELEEGGYDDAVQLVSDFLRSVVDAAQLDGQRGSRSSVLEILQQADKLMERNKEVAWADFIADADEVILMPEAVTESRPTVTMAPKLHSYEEPVPDPIQLMEWADQGGCEATDGCWVELDGQCPHGCLSWFRVLIG